MTSNLLTLTQERESYKPKDIFGQPLLYPLRERFLLCSAALC